MKTHSLWAVRAWKNLKIDSSLLPVHPDTTFVRLFYYLRVAREQVEVSNGYTCSMSGARLLCHMARKQFLLGEGICLLASDIYGLASVGQLRGDERLQMRLRGLRIFHDGSITIGCTSIPWSEICWLALKMGWWKTKPKRKKKLCQTKS